MDVKTNRFPTFGVHYFDVEKDDIFLEETFADEETVYTFDYCINPGTCAEVGWVSFFELGICCEYGEGYFRVYMNGDLVGEAPEGRFYMFSESFYCN